MVLDSHHIGLLVSSAPKFVGLLPDEAVSADKEPVVDVGTRAKFLRTLMNAARVLHRLNIA